ncbi:MAG: MMPL family transporter, partial [Actinomycetia bacterium]|nr:MMPL family transporter [Actinomycetes bacterium]
VDRIARIIVGHSRQIMVVTALISLLSVAMLFRMSFNADVSSFALEGTEGGRAFLELQEKYDTADPINVIATLPDGETFRSREGLTTLVNLRDDLLSVDGVTSVATIVPEEHPITGDPITAADIATAPDQVIDALLAGSPVTDLLLDESGQNTLLLVIPADDATVLARTLADLDPPAGLEITLSGNPVIFSSVLDIMSWFLLVIPPLEIALLIGMFFLTIGDLRLSALALFPAGVGALWTFGLIFGLGLEIDIVTLLVPIFVIVMGSADGLHFVTHFQETASETNSVSRVNAALSEVGVPMILTTISTSAGFLSLLVTDVTPIRQLGVFAAIGIGFAGLISFFSLPALMSRLAVKDRTNRAILGPRVTVGLKALVRSRIPAIVVTGAIVAFALVFIPKLDVDSDQLFFFKDGDPVREAFAKTEEIFGGATPLAGEFVLEPSEGLDGIGRIEEVSREFEELPGVHRVFSVADVAATLSLEEMMQLASGGVTLPLGKMVSSDGLRFILFPSDFTTGDLEGWVAFAEETPEIRTLTGMPIIWDDISRLVLQAQMMSVVVAFILVALMLAISYRSLRETFVSLIPIALTIAAVLGFLAASGINLNLVTAVISSIVVGVGIDYTIHFIAAIDYARPAGDGYVMRAIDRAGRPIVANALGISVAMTALWLSPLKIHPQISMVMWVAMITAAITAIVVIPAFLPRSSVNEPV